MKKAVSPLSYELAKISFGIYLVDEVRRRTGKSAPTEADVRRLLARHNPGADAAPAKQISRYCQTDKSYLRDAREETLDNVATLLRMPLARFADFRQRLNPAFGQFRNYEPFVELAKEYLQTTESQPVEPNRTAFRRLFACDEKTGVSCALISYNFGERDPALPAFSFGADTDVRTERRLKDLFRAHAGLEVSVSSVAGEAIESFLENKPTNQVLIVIGLFGNRLTTWLTARHFLPETLRIVPAENCLYLDQRVYRPDRNARTDYALFAKIRLGEQRTAFVIGGIEGFGTERIGAFLEENWRQLPALSDSTTGQPVGDSPFLAVFQVSETTLTAEIIQLL